MKDKKISRSWLLCGAAAFFALTAADQFTKYLAVRYLRNTPGLVLIPGVFELSYVENHGIAWGMFAGRQAVFLILALAILAAVGYFWLRVPATPDYRAFRVLSVIFAAGAAGNAADRLFRGYVVDFFYFSLINFPVFNTADCFVCISLALIVILYRNEDFAWMKKS